MCGIAVSSSPAVWGFSSFQLTVFGKGRPFTVLRYRSFALSCLMQVNVWKILDLTVNEYAISDGYSMMKLVGHPITLLFDRCTINSKSHVFSRRLRLISGVYMTEILKKNTRDGYNVKVSVIGHKCGIGISSIFDTVFRYLPIFLTALRYWVPPNVPLRRAEKRSGEET